MILALLLAAVLRLAPITDLLLPGPGEIVYTSSATGDLDIYLMDIGRRLSVNFTRHAANDCCAAWSPDGRRLMFISWRDGRGELYQMDADGRHLQPIGRPSLRATSAELSPDHSRIVFVTSRDGNAEIYMVDTAGRNQQRLTWNHVNDFSPAWRPVGQPASNRICHLDPPR